MKGTPRRSCWKRKRWWAAMLLWLAALYPLSFGPFMYAFYRDWIPDSTLPAADIVYGPLVQHLESVPRLNAPFNAYAEWWGEQGIAANRRVHPEQYTAASASYLESSPSTPKAVSAASPEVRSPSVEGDSSRPAAE